MPSPQILYRKIDRSIDPVTGVKRYEPVWGGNQQNFISDIDAVAQTIMTRLLLLQGEWWENLSDGLPFFQEIAGKPVGHREAVVNLIIQQRILGSPFVTGVSSIQTIYDASTRSFTFHCVVQTAFGVVTITNIPTPPSAGL